MVTKIDQLQPPVELQFQRDSDLCCGGFFYQKKAMGGNKNPMIFLCKMWEKRKKMQGNQCCDVFLKQIGTRVSWFFSIRI